jgi:hypothetical protein
LCLALFVLPSFLAPALAQEPVASALPQGVRAVWDLNLATHETTPTRERVCLNGLWRWQPATDVAQSVPNGNWGFFKVPGCWPGITDYLQKDCQTLYPHPAWKNADLGKVATAWYQREFSVPPEWKNRRLALSVEYLNSLASVWVDDHKAGEIRFPGGEADLTAFCSPGSKHLLSLEVAALPLKAVMLSYSDTFGASKIQGRVERRGLCGDVYLLATPAQARITDVKVSTSVRQWEISVDAGLQGLQDDSTYALRAEIAEPGRKIKALRSPPFKGAELAKRGRFSFRAPWKPEKLWDTCTPQNTFELRLSLLDAHGRLLDAALPERIGFREFWIEGRDFYLNGIRICLCAVPLDNAEIGAAWATYPAARETLQRLKSFGINCVYTHNYGCEPGTHLGFAEILRAADDEGMLVSFSMPHFAQYEWSAPDADQSNGYAHHAEFYVRAAQNHPSVVLYAMSHNATGTEEEMNPDQIDGLHDQRNQWSVNGAKRARRAEAIVQALDPSRIVYHHSSGNLGSMHTANFYANFAPIQEMSDWFEHWATAGVKPLFLCEYAAPLSWDWMMYRGWYDGARTFGSARVPWELCMAEWNAQFLGDDAYLITDLEKECLRWEAAQFRAGKLWHRWDYPRDAIASPDFAKRNAIFAMYLTDNLRAFRTWGLSAFCPWDHQIYWKLRDDPNRARKDLKVDWEALQRPGFSPDYVGDQVTAMENSYEQADWIPTAAAQALYRNNMPLLACLGGKPAAFTSKDHNFLPGETVEKQIILINNSRQATTANCQWSAGLPRSISGSKTVRVEAGQQTRVPLAFRLPDETTPGRRELRATIEFGNGETQQDSLDIDVLATPASRLPEDRIALFDPAGETGQLLENLGLHCVPVDAASSFADCDILIVGKGALKPDSPAPDIGRVRDGLKVVMFEQTSAVLEKRFGFRVEEYGARTVFKRIPDHPLLAGIGDANLRDWRGEATLLPPRLDYKIGPRYAPEVEWCGLPVTRLWRAGNRGNVASVLIEKPARGDFRPVVDAGFGLQFSPLLEYREGKGMVLFCQMDVTGRTESDPAADLLARDILRYVAAWKPAPRREVVYAGDAPARQFLEQAGFSPRPCEPGSLSTGNVLVIGSGATKPLAGQAQALAGFAQSGGNILALGLDEDEANALLPVQVRMRKAEHLSAFFQSPGQNSPLAGVSPADVYSHDPRILPLVSSGAEILGDGVLAQATNAPIVFCQLAPQWFAGSNQSNLRRTYRRAACLTTRLLANMGAGAATPLLERFHLPAQETETRWLAGFYLDTPQEWDDPYRFFCW